MTYSLATTGLNANSPFTPQPLTVDDNAAGRAGDQQMAMATNSAFLCKGPDGQQRLYTIDPERSRPGGPLYLLAVGP